MTPEELEEEEKGTRMVHIIVFGVFVIALVEPIVQIKTAFFVFFHDMIPFDKDLFLLKKKIVNKVSYDAEKKDDPCIKKKGHGR